MLQNLLGRYKSVREEHHHSFNKYTLSNYPVPILWKTLIQQGKKENKKIPISETWTVTTYFKRPYCISQVRARNVLDNDTGSGHREKQIHLGDTYVVKGTQ